METYAYAGVRPAGRRLHRAADRLAAGDCKTARTIAYRRGDAIEARPLTAMLRQIVANNRAGGWRKLKPG
jgi:hypothetical protein